MVEISANISKLDAELKKGENRISSFVRTAASSLISIAKYVGIGIAGATAAITYLLLTTTTKIADMVDEAQELSLPTAELQRFRFGASLAGISAEGLGTSIRFMLKNVEEAGADPLSEVGKAISALGLSAQHLTVLNTGEQFRQIANAFGNISDNGQRVKLAMAIFGRQGVQMLSLFRDGIDATTKEFEELGLSLTETQAQAVAKWDDAYTKLLALWGGFKEQIVATVAPAFEAISNFILKLVKDFGGMGVAGREAGVFILRGMLFAIRGMESFIKGFAEGLNQIIQTLETVAIAALEVAKIFITDDVKEANIDKQLGFLSADLAERQKPVGERAGKLFGEGFGDGLSSVGDILEAEITKITGEMFPKITESAQRELKKIPKAIEKIGGSNWTGSGVTPTFPTVKELAKQAEIAEATTIVTKYDAISEKNNKNLGETVKSMKKITETVDEWGNRMFSNIPDTSLVDKFAQGVDKWNNPIFGNVEDENFMDTFAQGRDKWGNQMFGNVTDKGIVMPDVDPEQTKFVFDFNILMDKTGNFIAKIIEHPAMQEFVGNTIVNLFTGTQKITADPKVPTIGAR